MTVMTSGMAHVSGGIMAAYILYGIEAKHLLAAVIMTAPGTVLMAKMLVPEMHTPATMGRVTMPINREHREENLLGAIARGTIDGGRLAFNVGIMLISFLALIGLLNGMLGGLHNWLGGHHIPFPESLNAILGFVFAPVAWLIGIPWHSAHQFRQSSGHAHGDQRIGGVRVVGRPEVIARLSVFHHRHVCRCADLPTSARSGCRLAASGLWRRTGGTILARLGIARDAGGNHG